MERKSLGERGEAIARGYFQKQKYQILVQNYRCRYGEIDLIVEKNTAVTFVEVKYRTSLDFGLPQESVKKRKQRKIKRVATIFLKEQNLWDKVDCHFDVLALYEASGKMIIEHIKDAFW